MSKWRFADLLVSWFPLHSPLHEMEETLAEIFNFIEPDYYQGGQRLPKIMSQLSTCTHTLNLLASKNVRWFEPILMRVKLAYYNN